MKTKLDKLSTEELGKLFPITISEYNPEWPDIFEKEKSILLTAINSETIINIEHIGSTAVAGLAAKPTIDILLEITDETDTKNLIKIIKELDYNYIYRPENPAPHIMFVKGYAEEGFKGQAFHIHVRFKGDWDEKYFRDYLREHPETVFEYASLKYELAEKYKNNREAYTEAKTDFIQKINEIARKNRK